MEKLLIHDWEEKQMSIYLPQNINDCVNMLQKFEIDSHNTVSPNSIIVFFRLDTSKPNLIVNWFNQKFIFSTLTMAKLILCATIKKTEQKLFNFDKELSCIRRIHESKNLSI